MQKVIKWLYSKPFVAKYGFKMFVWWQSQHWVLKRYLWRIAVHFISGLIFIKTFHFDFYDIVPYTLAGWCIFLIDGIGHYYKYEKK